MKSIRGILFDIGGVLYVGNRPVDGARELVASLRTRYRLRFATNTTRKPPAAIHRKLSEMGFEIEAEEIFTALEAARRVVAEAGGKAVTILTEESERYFGSLHSSDTTSPFVVVGDAGERFSYLRLNRAFRTLINGARLIAAAKNRYFKDSDGALSMDAGGFVAALEYAAGVEADVVGKPSREFFLRAVDSMGLEPAETLMVGDDIESDIAGAQRAGLKAVLVKTGKYRPGDLERGIVPDGVIDSVAGLEAWLGESE